MAEVREQAAENEHNSYGAISMKSILQNIALLSSILLIASCGGGGGSSANVGVSLPDPQNGVVGQVVKGAVSGATITVQDGTGDAKASTATVTTDATGSYALTFTPAEISDGIAGPLFVTATGGSTVCDYDNPASATDDCPVGDGTFVAFGSAYALAADFELTGFIPVVPADSLQADPIVTVNVSPASELATQLAVNAAAGGNGNRAFTIANAITIIQSQTAAAQVIGLIQALTGIDLSGVNLWSLALVGLDDSAGVAGASLASLAVSSFNAAIFGQIDADNTSIAAAIAALTAAITVNADGTISVPANVVGKIASTLATAANGAGASNAALVALANTASATAAAAANLPDGADFTFGQGGSGATDDPLATSKSFVGNLATAINAISTTTGAGITTTGATETFAANLRAADNASSDDARNALNDLYAALIAEEADAERDGTLASANSRTTITGSITVADGSTTIAEGGVTAVSGTATVAIASGSRVTTTAKTATSATGSLTLSDVSVTAKDSEGATTASLTSGQISATFTDEGKGTDLGLTTLDMTGTLTDSAGTAAAIRIVLTGVSGTSCIPTAGPGVGPCPGTDEELNTDDVSGSYRLELSIPSQNLGATISGENQSSTQSYTVVAGGVTINGSVTRTGTVDKNILTEGAVASCGTGSAICLTVMTDNATGRLVGPVEASGTNAALAEIKAGATQTATVSGAGTVTYSDGTIQSLPGAI